MAKTEIILELDDVTLDEAPGYDVVLKNASLKLIQGELAIVMLERPNYKIPLADVAEGLLETSSGEASFLGKQWRRCLPGKANRQRGMIGRVFEGLNWVSNLNVDENVLLPQRHHHFRSDRKLCAEAQALAKHFGLESLPTTRPNATKLNDLKRAALVRAFLGEPCLVILERPNHGMPPEAIEPIVDATETVRQRGGAVLWLTNLNEVWNHQRLNPTARYNMNGASLQPVTQAT